MVKEILKLLVTFGVVGGIAIAPNLSNKKIEENNINLPTVDTYENLKSLVAEANKGSENYGGFLRGEVLMNAAVPMKQASSLQSVSDSTSVNESVSSKEYSTTNVQVEGVDEADVIKNDGKYAYHLVNNQLVISQLYPATDMKVLSKTKFDENFNASDLYIKDDLVIVLGTRYDNEKYDKTYNYYRGGENYTTALINDVSDRSNPKFVKKVETNGYYVSSRMIGDYLYFVANKNLYIGLFDGNENVMPLLRDTSVSDETKKIELSCVNYIPEFKSSEYVMTVGVDLKNLKKEAQISTCLGNSQNIYSSEDNMYITFTSYDRDESATDAVAKKLIADDGYESNSQTSIYRFRLDEGKVECKATGKVSGTVLNQFSMDENGEYFRIATTKGSIYSTDKNKATNNMYVLDRELKTVGSIEDIAPGEKIYSVRFMGDRAYMVTFRKVDPLFVIDLSEPTKPTILGKLKIPGYSDYLHPYDENHIIGFGKDAEVVSAEDGMWGWVDEEGTIAYYQGMKIAVFDVTDPNNPVEMFKENIGDRGTNSELLHNHKALLFSKEKNLLAFPINVCTRPEGSKSNTYGNMTFEGAYVYGLDLVNGFELKAKLTNLTKEDWDKLGYYYYGDKSIDRLIYIGNTIYTIADCGYSAYDMNGYEKIGELKI